MFRLHVLHDVHYVKYGHVLPGPVLLDLFSAHLSFFYEGILLGGGLLHDHVGFDYGGKRGHQVQCDNWEPCGGDVEEYSALHPDYEPADNGRTAGFVGRVLQGVSVSEVQATA